MGIYWLTYLCSGTFTDKNTATIAKKVKLASCDPIIEQHEWEQGFVDLEELRKFVITRNNIPMTCCGTHKSTCNDEKIQLVPMEWTDLFLEEQCATTLDIDAPPSSKYILVQNGYTYSTD